MIERRLIRLIIILMIIFQNLSINAQTVSDSAKIEYENRIKKDTINRVYIPKNLTDCINQLNKLLADSVKVEIKEMSEIEFTSSVHLTLGMWLRNNWGLWAGSRLQIYMINLKFTHPDEMSSFILSCYYKSLQGRKINIKHEIKNYREKYKANLKAPTIQFNAKTIDNKYYKNIDSALIVADKIMEISFENIQKLPKNILKFTNLQSITIERSPKLNWKKTFKTLSQFPKLKELYLFENNVNNYPDEIGIVSQLSRLWISGDSIKTLPVTINQLKNLQELKITNCQKIDLLFLFNQLVVLKNLVELDLSNNSLSSIPREINQLQQIKELWLDYNLLTEIPKGVKELSNLTYLSLFSGLV